MHEIDFDSLIHILGKSVDDCYIQRTHQAVILKSWLYVATKG